MRLVWSIVLLAACNANFSDDNKDPVRADSGGNTDTSNEETGDTGGYPIDADGDGHNSEATGGDDCDDADPHTYPGAEELCDGVDNDCSGGTNGEADSDGDTLLDCNDYCPVFALPGAGGDGRPHDPMGLLQDAVDEAGASGCNEVRAFYGTYEENVDFHGYGVNMESISGPASTVIDGGGADSCIILEEDGDGDLDEDNARVSGFTITGGGGGIGAGIRITECSPTIEDNLITGNTITTDTVGNPIGDAGGVGGGVRIYEGSPSILGNEITLNDACVDGPETGCDGGAVNIRGGAPIVMDNVMTENSAGDGGAIWVAYSDALIRNNWISGNTADDSAEEDGEGMERDGQGGGINVQIGGPNGTTIENNVLSDNTASALGGGVVVYEPNEDYAKVTIANNVIAFNNVIETDWGAGFTQWNSTTPTVYNNIIFGNIGVGAYADDAASSFSFSYNLVNGNFPDYADSSSGSDLWASAGIGNLASDPAFKTASNDLDWTNDDFSLNAASPCVDAGKPDVLDADGTRSDCGAYGGPAGSW